MKLIWSPSARRRMDAIFKHMTRDNPEAAARTRDEIHAAARDLSKFNYLGRTGLKPGTYEFYVHGTPYTLVYRVYDDSVQNRYRSAR